MSIGVVIGGRGGIGGRLVISRLWGVIGCWVVGLSMIGSRVVGFCMIGGRMVGVGVMRVLGGMHEGVLVGVLVQLVQGNSFATVNLKKYVFISAFYGIVFILEGWN